MLLNTREDSFVFYVLSYFVQLSIQVSQTNELIIENALLSNGLIMLWIKVAGLKACSMYMYLDIREMKLKVPNYFIKIVGFLIYVNRVCKQKCLWKVILQTKALCHFFY